MEKGASTYRRMVRFQIRDQLLVSSHASGHTRCWGHLIIINLKSEIKYRTDRQRAVCRRFNVQSDDAASD